MFKFAIVMIIAVAALTAWTMFWVSTTEHRLILSSINIACIVIVLTIAAATETILEALKEKQEKETPDRTDD